MKQYKFICEPITPMIIGTGKALDPLQYVIREGQFLRISNELFFKFLPESKKEELLKKIDQNDWISLRAFVAENVPEDAIMYNAKASPNVIKTYQTKLNDFNNQLLVDEMIRNPRTFNPLIPGSSLKGAIRTAVLSNLAQERKIDLSHGNSINHFEKMVLGNQDAKNDPFRAIHCTDCEIKGSQTNSVSEFYNFKGNRRRGEDLASMQMIKEHITGHILGGDGKGEALVTIDEELLQFDQQIGRWNPIRLKLDIDLIMESVFNFYINNFEREFEKFYKKAQNPLIKQHAGKIMQTLGEIEENPDQLMLRIGRFSHFENVTVEEYRQSPPKGYGNTRALSEELSPVGLLRVKVIELE